MAVLQPLTFLTLCQRVRQECGISGSGPTTVVGQSGEMLRIVNWVQSAWTEIQELRSWNWQWTPASVQVTSGVRVYDPAVTWALNVHDWDFDTFRLYQTALSIADEQFLQFMLWDEFKLMYVYGTPQTQRPQVFTRRPDEKIMFDFVPDTNYTLEAEYTTLPTALSANNDTPSMPARFHELIVWKACQYYAEYEEAGVLLDIMRSRYKRMLTQMEEVQLPVMRISGPLA